MVKAYGYSLLSLNHSNIHVLTGNFIEIGDFVERDEEVATIETDKV